jgi:hypothetical protein
MTGVSTPNIARRTRGEGARPSEQSPSTPRCTSRTPALRQSRACSRV